MPNPCPTGKALADSACDEARWRVIVDRATRDTLRCCIPGDAERDPVDSLDDAEVLCAVQKLRLGVVLPARVVGRQGWSHRPMRRRRFVGLALALQAGAAMAGAQQYEPLAASVRAALHAAVADTAPPEPRFASPASRTHWLAEMSSRLVGRMPDEAERRGFLLSVHYEAQRAGLDPRLVLALIQVESAFRRYAISAAGARGYMQVMPFWTALLGDGDAGQLFDQRINLRYGCTILRHYLDREQGNLFRALGRYNGSLGRPEYPDAVLAAWKRWAYTTITDAAAIPPGHAGRL